MSRVVVALSGGIDSSVTALLLKKQGYEVLGVCAKTTENPEAALVVNNAQKVAEMLDIPFYSLDVTNIFNEKVIKYFEDSYRNGATPNPCIMCNKYMKWGRLFDFAIKELDADYIATGHYANIKNDNGTYKLYPASDEHKDQLYFLFLLKQEQLKKTLFPLSFYKKDDVRKIAVDNNLPSKSSKESQDICFIKAPMTTKKYLNNIFSQNPGFLIEKSTGKKLGTHNGFWQYTIGQRKGIGLAAPEALYVTDIDAKNNTVFVGYKNELLAKSLILKDIQWSYPQQKSSFDAKAKIRYNMQAADVHVETDGKNAKLVFSQSVSAIARGQACVLYDKNNGHLLGGAFI